MRQLDNDGLRRAAPPGHLNRTGRDQSGVAAIEFSLVAPVLFMMIFGAIEVGRILFAQHSLDEAARVSARWVTVHGSKSSAPATQATAIQKAREVAGTGAGVEGTVTFQPDNSPGSIVVVSLSRDHTFVLPFIPAKLLTLTARASQVIQN